VFSTPQALTVKTGQGATVRDSFEDFYERHKDGVLRAVFVASGDVEAAQDAVDEAFTRAFQHWARIQDHPSAVAWVTRTALNTLTSSWRRRAKMVVGSVPDRGVDPELPIDRSLVLAVLDLPERQRQVVALRILLDLSIDETARTLGIAPGTVTAHLSRATAALRSSLNEEVVNDGV